MTQPTLVDKTAQVAVQALPTVAWIVVVLALVIALFLAQTRARNLALRADSLSAVADTVRRQDGATMLRAIQASIKADVAEALSHQQPVAVVRDTVYLASVVDSGKAQVSGDAVRHAAFDLRDPPYTSHADVSLPATGEGSLRLSITQDPIPLLTQVECGVPANGVRPVQVRVTAPPAYRLGLSQPVVDPNVCNAVSVPIHAIPWKVALPVGLGLFLLGWLRP